MMFSNREVVDTRAGTAVMEWLRPRGAINTGGVLSLPDPTKLSASPINYRVSIFSDETSANRHLQLGASDV